MTSCVVNTNITFSFNSLATFWGNSSAIWDINISMLNKNSQFCRKPGLFSPFLAPLSASPPHPGGGCNAFWPIKYDFLDYPRQVLLMRLFDCLELFCHPLSYKRKYVITNHQRPMIINNIYFCFLTLFQFHFNNINVMRYSWHHLTYSKIHWYWLWYW